MEQLQKILESITSLADELKFQNDKFISGNISAGGKARKISMEIKKQMATYKKVSIDETKRIKEEKRKDK